MSVDEDGVGMSPGSRVIHCSMPVEAYVGRRVSVSRMPPIFSHAEAVAEIGVHPGNAL